MEFIKNFFKKKQKPECYLWLMDFIIKEVINAPQSQITERVRKDFQKMANLSPIEKYYAISYYGGKSYEEFLDHNISGFVAELCDLKKHYLPPKGKRHVNHRRN